MVFGLCVHRKKEQKRIQQMLASMEVGDTALTTSGFYGVIIDITDEDVIVEFGNNKNCRIPMQKAAIAQIEKSECRLIFESQLFWHYEIRENFEIFSKFSLIFSNSSL